MNEEWVTPEWAIRQAERMEADALRMRELAERLSNRGLLLDERDAEIEDWKQNADDSV